MRFRVNFYNGQNGSFNSFVIFNLVVIVLNFAIFSGLTRNDTTVFLLAIFLSLFLEIMTGHYSGVINAQEIIRRAASPLAMSFLFILSLLLKENFEYYHAVIYAGSGIGSARVALDHGEYRFRRLVSLYYAAVSLPGAVGFILFNAG